MEMAFRECVTEAKERGQTVFLSSHILSEVEAVCDRVGILRAGKLVDEGTLAELRHLSAQTVEVTFDGRRAEAPAAAGGAGGERAAPERAALRGRDGRDRPADRRAGRAPGRDPDQPRAVARGDLPAPLRRAVRRAWRSASALAPPRAFADARIRTIAFACLFAAVAYIQPVSYRHAYPTLADRLAFAHSFGSQQGGACCSTARRTTC